MLIAIQYLIHAFKYQAVVVILESLGNLFPKMAHTVAASLVFVRIGSNPCPYTGIMMDVNNAIHIAVKDIVHDFLNAIQPFLVNIGIPIGISEVGYRNAYGFETCLGHHFNHSLGGNRIAPAGFGVFHAVAL